MLPCHQVDSLTSYLLEPYMAVATDVKSLQILEGDVSCRSSCLCVKHIKQRGAGESQLPAVNLERSPVHYITTTMEYLHVLRKFTSRSRATADLTHKLTLTPLQKNRGCCLLKLAAYEPERSSSRPNLPWQALAFHPTAPFSCTCILKCYSFRSALAMSFRKRQKCQAKFRLGTLTFGWGEHRAGIVLPVSGVLPS